MNKGTKILIAVLADMALLVLIVLSVRYLLFHTESAVYRRIFSGVIIVAIPVMFFISFTTFAGDRYDYDPDAFEGDDAELEQNAEPEADDHEPLD